MWVSDAFALAASIASIASAAIDSTKASVATISVLTGSEVCTSWAIVVGTIVWREVHSYRPSLLMAQNALASTALTLPDGKEPCPRLNGSL